MTIEELLIKLQDKGDEFQKECDDYDRKFKEVGKEIKEYYESPFLTPTDIPTELMNKALYWHDKSLYAFCQNRDIQITIKNIRNIMKES